MHGAAPGARTAAATSRKGQGRRDRLHSVPGLSRRGPFPRANGFCVTASFSGYHSSALISSKQVHVLCFSHCRQIFVK